MFLRLLDICLCSNREFSVSPSLLFLSIPISFMHYFSPSFPPSLSSLSLFIDTYLLCIISLLISFPHFLSSSLSIPISFMHSFSLPSPCRLPERFPGWHKLKYYTFTGEACCTRHFVFVVHCINGMVLRCGGFRLCAKEGIVKRKWGSLEKRVKGVTWTVEGGKKRWKNSTREDSILVAC